MTDHTSPPPDGASALDFCLRLARHQADARDARVGYAVITEAGQALLIHADATAQALGQELLGSAGAEQLAPLSMLLAGIAGSQPGNG